MTEHDSQPFYQWVKFKPETENEFTDYEESIQRGEWVLAENCGGYFQLMGVLWTIDAEQVLEYGPRVKPPK